MTEFKDSEGRKWALNLTLGSAKHVFDKLGVDLLNPSSMVKTDVNGEMIIEESQLPRLIQDDLFIGEIVAQLISNQAVQRKLSDEDVLNIFDAVTLKNAHTAFLDEYRSFFMERGNAPGAKLVETLLESVSEMQNSELLGETSPESPEPQESPIIETTLGTN